MINFFFFFFFLGGGGGGGFNIAFKHCIGHIPDKILLLALQWYTDYTALYNQQSAIVGPMLAFKPIFMSIEFATGGPQVVFVRWWCVIIGDLGKLSKNFTILDTHEQYFYY